MHCCSDTHKLVRATRVATLRQGIVSDKNEIKKRIKINYKFCSKRILIRTYNVK